jgi:hypothetical protein
LSLQTEQDHEKHGTMMRLTTALGLLLLAPVIRAEDHGFQKETFGFSTLEARLPKPLSDFTASLDISTGLAYLAGGCDSEKGNEYSTEYSEFICTSVSDKLYSFDKDAGTFTTLTDMPYERYRHGAVLINNQLWLMGGRDSEETLIPTVDVSFKSRVE